MFNAFFFIISHCVCEPFAVGALIGITAFLILHWRKSRSETLLIAAALLVAIGWRVLLPIRFDRYALFLVPVAIFFTVWGVRVVAGWCRRFLLLPGLPWNFLWYLGLLITVACISLIHNNEDRAFFPLLEVFRREIRDVRTPVILWCKRDFAVFLDSRAQAREMHHPERLLRKLDRADVAEYLLSRHPRKSFRDIENMPDRKLIARVDGGGRRKFSYGLWKIQRRFLRLKDRSEVDKYAAPETGNLLANAGFETARTPRETAALAKRYVGMGAAFYRKNDLKLPAMWNPIMLPAKPGCEPPEFELSSDAPIRGKYSLRIKVSPKFSREIAFSKQLSSGTYLWSMLVRAKKGTKFRLYFHAFRKRKYAGDRNAVICTIPEDGTYFLSVPVDRSIMRNGEYFTAAIGGLSGELFVDEVSLVPLPGTAER